MSIFVLLLFRNLVYCAVFLLVSLWGMGQADISAQGFIMGIPTSLPLFDAPP